MINQAPFIILPACAANGVSELGGLHVRHNTDTGLIVF